jgi:membrane-associated protein
MFSVQHILESGGLIAVGLIIFAESGLFFGFLLPGDTLLLAAGFFAGQGKLPIGWLIGITITAAILGDNVGYQVGRRLGPRLFTRKEGFFFRREYLERTEQFYKKYGGITIILARFIAYVRTFAPSVAGVGNMSWPRFAVFNVIGATLWGAGLLLIGYTLGNSFPQIDQYFLTFLFICAQLTLLFLLWEIFRHKENRVRFKAATKDMWRHVFKPRSNKNRG